MVQHAAIHAVFQITARSLTFFFLFVFLLIWVAQGFSYVRLLIYFLFTICCFMIWLSLLLTHNISLLTLPLLSPNHRSPITNHQHSLTFISLSTQLLSPITNHQSPCQICHMIQPRQIAAQCLLPSLLSTRELRLCTYSHWILYSTTTEHRIETIWQLVQRIELRIALVGVILGLDK